MFDQVRRDVCFPDEANVLEIHHSPTRWDEVLDLGLTTFISSACGPWEVLLNDLSVAGLSDSQEAYLVDGSGCVRSLTEVQSPPQDDEWSVVLNWSHPNQGWRSRLPLSGRRYIVTRESGKAKAMTAQLEVLGARATALPTITFTPPDDPTVLEEAFERLSTFHWIVLTSPNGVRYFFERMEHSECDHRELANTKFACIGPSTAKSLKSVGFRCDLIPEQYVAESLIYALESSLGPSLSELEILIPRAQEAREILPDTLRSLGAKVTVAPTYKTVPPDMKNDVAFHPEQRVLFTSSSTVKNWVELTSHRIQPCFCIGPVTATTARDFGLPILGVAESHTVEGLLQEVQRVDVRT